MIEEIIQANKVRENDVLAGVMGLCVADALGVPVEFSHRKTLQKNPVKGMRAYGTYNQPVGTWSDDTSMTLCLMDSLQRGLDYDDIMQTFLQWFDEAKFTPHGETFDIGNTTLKALERYKDGIMPTSCGGQDECDNGNGALMRILPIAFHLKSRFGFDYIGIDEAMDIIQNVASLTHAHKRSLVACGIYISIANQIMLGRNLEDTIKIGMLNALSYYNKCPGYSEETHWFKRISMKGFSRISETSIKSTGYVVDTLEAAIWCLLNTDNYRDCILKAVNLGNDTDTVAAVAGGLAGLYYGYESIPEDWLVTIVKRNEVEDACKRFYLILNKYRLI